MNKRGADARAARPQQRFGGYIGLAISGILTPNFTTLGFSVVPQPPGVHERLNRSLHEGLEAGPHSEHFVDQISGPDADFVNIKGLGYEIMRELLPAHEAWIGGAVPLRANTAYGLRVYREGNSLTMHTDRVSDARRLVDPPRRPRRRRAVAHRHRGLRRQHVRGRPPARRDALLRGARAARASSAREPREIEQPRARASFRALSLALGSLTASPRSRLFRPRAPAPPRSPPSARTAGRAR